MLRSKTGVIIALICAVVFTAVYLISDNRHKHQDATEGNRGRYTAKDFVAPLPVIDKAPATPTPTQAPVWLEQFEKDREEALESFEGFTSYFLELEPLGKYYITAYSPQETGSWITASGIKLHRADNDNRYTEPTTCAVDPKLHKIGKNGVKFYIEEFDRVFIAQDTGCAVKGRHLDLAYTDLKSVKRFPTGKYYTYKVISVTKTEYTKENICQDF